MLKPSKFMYKQIDYTRLTMMLDNPRDHADNPYDLFLIFVLESIKEALLEPDEEDRYTVQNLWFLEVVKEDLDHLLQDCIADYSSAIKNQIPIRFSGQRWSIRRFNIVDCSRLNDVFQFPEKDGKYILDPAFIMEIEKPILEGSLKTDRDLKADIAYQKHLKEFAEASDDNWDLLTDMEVAVYCWIQYAEKHIDQRFTEKDINAWYEKYKDYHGVPLKEIKMCYHEMVDFKQKGIPQSPYCFTKYKIDRWNEAHNQRTAFKST